MKWVGHIFIEEKETITEVLYTCPPAHDADQQRQSTNGRTR